MTHNYTTLRKSSAFICRNLLILIVMICSISTKSNAQVSAYSFTPLSGSFTALVGGTAVTTILTDDATSAAITLPFTFTYDGVGYTQVKACSNGWLTFNSTATNTDYTNDLDFCSTLFRPLVAPLWDDLHGSTGTASYLTTGVAPNRVFTFEWLNFKWNYLAASACISFQVKLYEGTNVIEFVYRQEAGTLNSASASIGLAGASTGVNNFISLTDASAAPSFSSTTETITIASKPATGQIYRFTPPTPCTGTPTAGSIPATSSACSGIAGANSLTVTGYTTGVTGITFQWEESNDNGVGDPWANAVGGTGATTATYTFPALVSPIYYRCKVTCTPSGLFAYTNSSAVSIISCSYDVTYTNGASWSSIIPSNGGIGTAFTSWVGTSGDDNTTMPVNLTGTTFQYQGNPVTQFVACTNGWMSFTNTTSTVWTNSLTSTSQTKVLAPFWDDLVMTGTNYANRDNCMRYQIDGVLGSGSAIITIEWANMERFTIPGPNLNFQVKLYEAGNVIEFVYGNFEGYDGTVTSTYSYSVGYNGANPAGLTAYDRFAMQTAVTNHFSASSDPASHMYLPDCYSKFTITPGTYTGPGVAPTIPAPGNDNTAGAYTLTVNPTACTTPNLCDTYYNSRNATNSGLGTAACSVAGYEDDDVFFKFFTTAATNYTINLRCSPGYDGVIQLLDASLTPILCQNSTGLGAIETMSATGLTPGGTQYYIRIFHNGVGNGSTGQFSICLYQSTPPPANDECSGAIGLTVGTSCSYTVGSTSSATASAVAACTGTADDDVWYSFVATDANPIVTVQSGAGFNAVFNVYSGTCASLTQLNCINATTTAGLETVSMTGLTIGATYYVRVYHFAVSSGSGNFTICVYNPVPGCTTYTSPANLATGVSTTGVNLTWSAAAYATNYDVYFGTSPSPGFFANTTGTSYPTGVMAAGTTYYWYVIPKNAMGSAAGCTTYSFTTSPTCTGTPTAAAATSSVASVCSAAATFTLNAPGSSTESGITYQWEKNNGGGWTIMPGATTLSYVATESETNDYHVIVTCTVSGFSATSLPTTVTFSLTPLGDLISNPIVLSLPAIGVAGNNLTANCWTNNIGNVSPDVYYQVTPSCNGSMTAATCASTGTLGDTYIRILNSGGTELAFNDDGCASLKSTATITVTAGSIYYVVVEGYSSNEGTWTVDITTTSVFSTFYADADGDGFGNLLSTVSVCDGIAPAGYVGNSDDCNDGNAAVNPLATELCNGYDDDCDGLTDDSDPGVIGVSTWYYDGDSDGFGNAGISTSSCVAPAGYVDNPDDCDDAVATTNPGADEICGNGADDNCDGTIDEGTVFETWYADVDGDLYGNAASTVSTCDGPPAGYVADATDCDDAHATAHPGGTEVCDGLDNDCDGLFDEGVVTATVTPAVSVETCRGITTILTANACEGCTYQWFKNDAAVLGATNITYGTSKPGFYSVQVTTAEGCFAVSEHTEVIVNLNPNANIFAPNGTSLCTTVKLKTSYDATYTFQWHKNGVDIAGATTYLIIATTPGTYDCTITTNEGCSRTTASMVVTACRGEAQDVQSVESFDMYPNPTDHSFTLDMQFANATNGDAVIEIYNIAGDVVFSTNAAIANNKLVKTIDLGDQIAAGIYVVKVTAGTNQYTEQLVIQK